MVPNCKNCAYYRKKKCQYYNALIQDPETTTCLEFIKRESSKSFVFALVSAMVATFLFIAVFLLFFKG